MEALRTRSRVLQDAVQWESPSARSFRGGAESLTVLVGAAAVSLEAASDGLRRARAHLVTMTAMR